MFLNLWPILKREYITRVKNKWFWITTILGPIGFGLIAIAPALLTTFEQEAEIEVALINLEENLQKSLEEQDQTSTFSYRIESWDQETAQENLRDTDSDLQAVVDFDPVDFSEGEYSPDVTSKGTLSRSQEELISENLRPLIAQERLDFEDVEAQEAQRLTQSIRFSFSTLDDATPTSDVAYGLAIITGFIMYFFLISYSSSIMQKVGEEKKNRIVEILLSSANEVDILFGKIIGALAVGLTQIGLWLVLTTVLVLGISFIFTPEEPIEPQGVPGQDIETAAEVEANVTSLIQSMDLITFLPLFIAYLFMGMLFYAGLSGAIGASSDSDEDLQNLSVISILPIIIGFISSFFIINNPDTLASSILSMIPFISPLTMMARIPFDVPAWEIALSITILFLSSVGMIWLSAKIYRIGILLYGERLSWKHIKTLFK